MLIKTMNKRHVTPCNITSRKYETPVLRHTIKFGNVILSGFEMAVSGTVPLSFGTGVTTESRNLRYEFYRFQPNHTSYGRVL